MDALNINCLRVYTLLPPDFYRAFKSFNDARVRRGVRPIFLLHGIYSPEAQLNEFANGTDVYRADINAVFQANIASVVGAVHGSGKWSVRPDARPRAHAGRACGSSSRNLLTRHVA